MSTKAERERIIRSGSPTRWHSLNQDILKREAEGRKRTFGSNKKVARAHERRRREERFIQDFPKVQFERALGHMLNGQATDEEVIFVFNNEDNLERYGHKVDRFEFPGKNA